MLRVEWESFVKMMASWIFRSIEQVLGAPVSPYSKTQKIAIGVFALLSESIERRAAMVGMPMHCGVVCFVLNKFLAQYSIFCLE